MLGAYFPDQDGEQRPIIMGCYGIGVGRLLAAAIEQNNDDKGIVFSPRIAPYDVSLVVLNMEDEAVMEAAEALHEELTSDGIQVLYDDRTESPGVKFNDADLLGLPVRAVVSRRNVRDGGVEVKMRSSVEALAVPRDDVLSKVKELLAS